MFTWPVFQMACNASFRWACLALLTHGSVQCLVETNADMDEEWNLCLAIANSNAKNYQLWNHRRKCALRMGPENAEREMEFASAGLELDAKNYHIWAHRQVHTP